MSGEPMVRMQDARALRLCARGVRAWLAHHGMDVSRFISDGLPASTIEATGDGLGIRVAAVARERARVEGVC